IAKSERGNGLLRPDAVLSSDARARRAAVASSRRFIKVNSGPKTFRPLGRRRAPRTERESRSAAGGHVAGHRRREEARCSEESGSSSSPSFAPQRPHRPRLPFTPPTPPTPYLPLPL